MRGLITSLDYREAIKMCRTNPEVKVTATSIRWRFAKKGGKRTWWRMYPGTTTWWKSILVVFVTILFHGVEGHQLAVQESECISQFVGHNDAIVFGSVLVVDEFIESYSNEDDVEMLITGPSGQKVLSMKARVGQKFQFNAARVGDFKICFFNPTAAPKKVDFTIHVGPRPEFKDLAKDENFGPLEAKIGQLREAIERLTFEQQHYRSRDLRHRQTNENTQKRLLWYTVFEYLCLIVASLAQVYLVQTRFSRRIGYNNV